MSATLDNRVADPTSREQRTLEFFARWGESFDACCDSLTDLLADDCVWDQRPIPRLTGPTQAIRFMKIARRTLGLQTVDVEILHIASAGDVVHVARIDRLRRADGSLIAAAPVAGVLQFQHDQVVHWRGERDAMVLRPGSPEYDPSTVQYLLHPLGQDGDSLRLHRLCVVTHSLAAIRSWLTTTAHRSRCAGRSPIVHPRVRPPGVAELSLVGIFQVAIRAGTIQQR